MRRSNSNRFKAILSSAAVGITVMAFELIAGKMTGSVFGSATLTWALVIGAVTGGLFLGYLAGSYLSLGKTPPRWIQAAFLMGAIHIIVFLWMGNSLIQVLSSNLDRSGAIIFTLISILPLNIYLGMISPLLVRMYVSNNEASGKGAGILFGISTAFGILGVLLFGFVIIPLFSLTTSLLSLIFLLMGGYLLWLRSVKITDLLLPAGGLILTLAFPLFRAPVQPDWVLYRNTGLNGELIVADISSESGAPLRVLLNNRIGQTLISNRTECSWWDYVYHISTLAGKLPAKNNALLLGLAGGTIANELVAQGYQVTAVDFDRRTYEVARQFFDLSGEVNFIQDDARHFLNAGGESYDLIVIDVFNGEATPEHLLSLEGTLKLRQRLTAGGLVLVNHHGIWEGDPGIAQRGLLATLDAAGLETGYLLTSGQPAYRNTVILASEDLDRILSSTGPQTPCAIRKAIPIDPEISYLSAGELDAAPVFKDEFPQLSRLNQSAYYQWREYALKRYVVELKKEGLRFY